MKKRLTAKWSKREDDIIFNWPDTSANGAYLHCMLTALLDRNASMLQELDMRGYDIKTLKISIEKKEDNHRSTLGEQRLLKDAY